MHINSLTENTYNEKALLTSISRFFKQYSVGKALEKVAGDESFLHGIERIKNGVDGGYNIVIVCTEKDPIKCHRAILMARSSYKIGMDIGHILANGVG